MRVRKFSIADAPFERAPDQHGDVFLGDVVGRRDGGPITVGFGRYAPDQTNAETLAFDEAIVVTRGRLTVRSDGGEVSAGPGEVVYMARGTAVTYVSHEAGAELVYVTYPHWKSARADLPPVR